MQPRLRLSLRFFSRFTIVLALIGWLPASTASEKEAPPSSPVPIETLFRRPYLTGVRLAPDGKSLAGVNHDSDGTSNLALLDFDRAGATILRGNNDLSVYSFLWLNNDSLLVQGVADVIYTGGLHLVDRKDFRRVFPIASRMPLDVVGRPLSRPENVILWLRRGEFDESNSIDLFEASSADIRRPQFTHSGTVGLSRHRVLYPEPKEKEGAVLGYDSDVDGELAVCYLYRDGKVHGLLFNSAQKKWEPLALNVEVANILAVEADHQHLWISTYVEGKGFEVYRHSTATGQREPAILSDPLFNPAEGSVYYSRRENKLVGVSYEQRRLRTAWFDPRFAALQRSVDRVLPRTDNRVVDFDTQEKLFLFYCGSAEIPGAYYLFDSEQNQLTPITAAYPWLADVAFSPTHAIQFKTRDGLQLEGYLTVPAGASAKHKVPLVVLCHGGPAARDSWGFDEESQFLASRGYAVLRPNFRGSTGYRPEISEKWKYDYRKMHEDVTDATKAIRQIDLIDGDRIAIMGASFGGFLAVAGAAFETDLYRCAITNSGVFDWEALVKQAKWSDQVGKYQYLKDHVGLPGKDRKRLAGISPLASADQIKIPVFIAHGRKDSVVDLAQSTKLAALLKRRKIPVETYFPKGEAHGFDAPATVFEYYRRLEKFLAQNLRANPDTARRNSPEGAR